MRCQAQAAAIERLGKLSFEVLAPNLLELPGLLEELPYCLSRLRQNPHILVWLMRDVLFGRAAKMLGRSARNA